MNLKSATTLVVLMFIPTLIGCDVHSTHTQTSEQPKSTSTASAQQPSQVEQPKQRPTDLAVSDAEAVVAEYERNEVAADREMKGKLFAVRGTIERIGKDILGSSYVALRAERYGFRSVQCFFSDDDEHVLASLQPGNSIVIAGTGKGLMGNVLLEDCWIYNEGQRTRPFSHAAQLSKDPPPPVKLSEAEIARHEEDAKKLQSQTEADEEAGKLKRRESAASSLLKSAHTIDGLGKHDGYLITLRKIVKNYAGTAAAGEAQKLLDAEPANDH